MVDIVNLITDLLANVLDKVQKENKVRNLIHAMSKRDKSKRKPALYQ